MAQQPISGDQWKAIGAAAGTAVITDTPCVFKKIIVPGTYVGTIKFHDAAATTGTTATSQILSLLLPLTNYPRVHDINVQCKNGLVYEATGTPSMTITWD